MIRYYILFYPQMYCTLSCTR